MLNFTSIIPYFILMGLFWCEALLIQKYVPFFRRAVAQETNDQSHNVPLDGLRGLLALGVFFTHALTFHYWIVTGNWVLPPSQFYSQLAIAPVAMFFIITGYLFWTKAQKKGIGPLRIYFLHRIRRLYPAYLFSSLLIVPIAFWVGGFHGHLLSANFFHSLVPYVTFSLAGGPPLDGVKSAGSINAGVTWSLRVEWMFYFMLPLLAFFARTKWRQLLLLAISVALYFGLPLVRIKFHNPFGLGTLMYFNVFLLTYFSVGMFLAYLKLNYKWEALADSKIASFLGIAFLLSLYFAPPHKGLREGLLLIVPMLFVVFGNSYFGLLQSKPFILLGQASYSIYLLHGIVLFVANKLIYGSTLGPRIGAWTFWSIHALIGMFVVVLAAFSYRWFEAPFMYGYGVKRR